MRPARIRPLLAITAVAAVGFYGLASHGPMTSHDGAMGATAGLCLLLATVLLYTATPRPEPPYSYVVRERLATAVASPPRRSVDGRARASPSALQRFRN